MKTTGPSDEIRRRMASPSVVLPAPHPPGVLARPPPADDAERLALAQLDADAVHRLDMAHRLAQHAPADREPDLEIVRPQHDGCFRMGWNRSLFRLCAGQPLGGGARR